MADEQGGPKAGFYFALFLVVAGLVAAERPALAEEEKKKDDAATDKFDQGKKGDALGGLERTAGMSSEMNRELVRELKDFKRELDALRADQRRLGSETEPLQSAWRERMAGRMKQALRLWVLWPRDAALPGWPAPAAR